jgi:hypothetical protein
MQRLISIEASFLWAQRLVAREWRLLLPVTLAFFMLPPLVVDFTLRPEVLVALANPQTASLPVIQRVMTWLFPLLLFVLLFGGVGSLALLALALRPRISVGEAIVIGTRRVVVLVGSSLLLFAASVALAVVLSILLAVARLSVGQMQTIMIALMMVGGVAVLVRLSMLGPVIVERRVGPVTAIGAGWRLGSGNGWRMFAVVALFTIGAVVVMLALNTAVAATLLLLGRLLGSPETAGVLIVLFRRLCGALINGGYLLLAASFFRQVDGPSSGI